MNPLIKDLVKRITIHALMVVAIGLTVAGTVLQFGYDAGLIALGAGLGIYAYLLGAE